jgi:hypothetical protein
MSITPTSAGNQFADSSSNNECSVPLQVEERDLGGATFVFSAISK